jgi:8-oxo-dGTP pyrophosphatase MutT (NUDIX family)
MGRKRRVVELVSAGGVVRRVGESGDEVVLCGRGQPTTWGLPKGTPEPGETRDQTALREVTEETGLEVEIDGPLDSIEYWFVRPSDRALCHKTVHYYLMSATGGDTSRHDHEFDVVRWFPVQEAVGTMTHENEARIVEEGIALASE